MKSQNVPPGAAPARAQAEGGSQAAPGPLDRLLLGRWTYRSFRNNPAPKTPFNDLRFGEGALIIESLNDGVMKGTLDFGPPAQVALTGAVSYGNPPTLQFQGRGISNGNSDWLGHLAFQWPQGDKQVPAIIGTIVRSQPHSGGAAEAGFVASWIAVRAGPGGTAAFVPESAASAMAGPSRRDGMRAAMRPASEGLQPQSELQQLWAVFAAGKPAPEARARSLEQQLRALSRSMRGILPLDQQADFLKREAFLPERQRESLAAASKLKFVPPYLLEAKDGVRILRVGLSDPQITRIGDQPVRLRTYNGKLVGPTIRCKPSETLRIRLENHLDANDPRPAAA